MNALRGSLFLVVVSSAILAACGDSPTSTADGGAGRGAGGRGGSTGTAGTGTAGTGTGTAGTGTAGTGAAGTGTAGTGAAGTGTAGTGAAGTGAAGTGAAGAKDGGVDAADAASDAVDAPKDTAKDTAGDTVDAPKDTAGDGVDAPKDTALSDGPDGGVGALASKAVVTIAHTASAATLAGTATFTDVAGIVTLVVNVTGCPIGAHGFHLHSNAACGNDAADAGGHWTPKGDTNLGTLTCLANGTGTVTYTTPSAGYWTIGGSADTNVLPHALVIHATADSPDGGAATRIGCGVPAAQAVATIAKTGTNTIAGTGTFTSPAGVTTLVINVTGCPMGAHPFHLHTNATCANDAADAGGHWTPKGDTNLGSLTCAADGTGTATYTAPSAGYWTVGGFTDSDILLHALVVHATADSPDGGATTRIGCGVPK